jgi:hypothetical protein
MSVETTRYVGTRTKQGCKVEKVAEGQDTEPLNLRLDLWNHSPTGFEFGYGGSGPAQTALAILADATGNDRLAVVLHQQFKWDFVAKAKQEGFELTADEIAKWVDQHKGKLDLSDWEDDQEEA